MRKIIIVLLSVLLVLMLFGCDGAGAGTGDEAGDEVGETNPSTTIDSATIDASPTAPEIVSVTGGGARALVSAEDQDFGPFDMIKDSASNYNGMVNMTVPEAQSNIVNNGGEEAEASIGNFVRKWEVYGSSHYENDDITVTATLSGSSTLEIRQFDAFLFDEAKGYSYSRCAFFWPDSSSMFPGVDITEVWEYPERKEVSVTMYNKDNDSVSKFLAVTDMSSNLQKTSMLFYRGDSSSSIAVSNYSKIGYIDFEMSTAGAADLSDHTGSEDVYLAGYPAFEKLEALHAKSATFEEAKAFNITVTDSEIFEPFVGFTDRSNIF